MAEGTVCAAFIMDHGAISLHAADGNDTLTAHNGGAGMVEFIGREQAKKRARKEPVIFVEIMGEANGQRSLEVHVMRPGAEGLYEVERDDTGLVPGETIEQLVNRIAADNGCRYATIYPAEDRWPPPWAARR